jgi:hypothetical protein
MFVELDLKLILMPAGNVRLVVHDGIEVIDIMETNDADERSVRRVMNEILRLAHVKGITPQEYAVRLKG